METRTPTTETVLLAEAPRVRGETTSGSVVIAADHDTLEVSISRDPAWSIGPRAGDTAAVVMCDVLIGGVWQETFCGFVTANDPVLPIGVPAPTRSSVRVSLGLAHRGAEFRARLRMEKVGTCDLRLKSSFEDVRIQEGRPPASVSFDATNSADGYSVTSISWTHTPVGTPSGVVVCGNSYAAAISSSTYGGTSCGLEGAATGVGVVFKSATYSLGSPGTGAKTVVVNFGASTGYGSGAATTVVGGDTSDVMDGVQTLADNGSFAQTSASLTITSSTGDLALVTLSYYTTGTPPTIGAGQTSRWTFNTVNSEHYGSTEPGAATVVMSYTISVCAFAMVAGNIRQAAGAAGGPHSLVNGGLINRGLIDAGLAA